MAKVLQRADVGQGLDVVLKGVTHYRLSRFHIYLESLPFRPPDAHRRSRMDDVQSGPWYFFAVGGVRMGGVYLIQDYHSVLDVPMQKADPEVRTFFCPALAPLHRAGK